MWGAAFFGTVSFRRGGVGVEVTDLAEEVRTFDVEVVAFVKVRLRRGFEVFQEHDSGTWDHNVDFAEFVNGLGDHALNVRDAAGITLDEQRVLRANLLGEILGRAGVGGVVDGDIGTRLGEEQRGGGSNALAAAGDESGLTSERSRHVLSWVAVLV